MDRAQRRLEFDRRTVYRNGWDILTTWVTCRCEPETCPLEAELDRLGASPGSLLLALVTGDPQLMVTE